MTLSALRKRFEPLLRRIFQPLDPAEKVAVDLLKLSKSDPSLVKMMRSKTTPPMKLFLREH